MCWYISMSAVDSIIVFKLFWINCTRIGKYFVNRKTHFFVISFKCDFSRLSLHVNTNELGNIRFDELNFKACYYNLCPVSEFLHALWLRSSVMLVYPLCIIVFNSRELPLWLGLSCVIACIFSCFNYTGLISVKLYSIFPILCLICCDCFAYSVSVVCAYREFCIFINFMH